MDQVDTGNEGTGLARHPVSVTRQNTGILYFHLLKVAPPT